VEESSEWEDDSQAGAEQLEQGDEALDEEVRLDPSFLEQVEGDPSLDPGLSVDELELEEAGLKLDDPYEPEGGAD
jgi:hypothetical protein